MIFEKAPDSGERNQVGDLRGRQTAERDPGVGIKLVVRWQTSRDRSRHSFCDRLAIHQQLKVVGPHRPRTCDENTKEYFLGPGVDRKRDSVSRPFVRARDLLRLHVVERNRLAVGILPQPQAGVPGDILKSQVAAKFYNASAEIKGQAARNTGSVPCALGVTLQSHGPVAGVDDTIIHGNRIRRVGTPTNKSRSGLIFKAQRLLDGGA
jgi:hypothetical protein